MSAFTQKVSTGAAACAIAAAATLTSAPAANADSSATPIASLGSQVGEAQCVPSATTTCEESSLPSSASLQAAASGFNWDSLIQNRLWWIGAANPNPPPRSPILEFTPMSLVPNLFKPVYGWFFGQWDLEFCVLGLTATIGPYLTSSVSVGRGCN